MVLKSLGIGNPLLSWLYTYITGRKPFVKVKDAVSDLSVIPSFGAPQGDHLSTLLFILFVNSITKWITKAKRLLFADDIQIFLNKSSSSGSSTSGSGCTLTLNIK